MKRERSERERFDDVINYAYRREFTEIYQSIYLNKPYYLVGCLNVGKIGYIKATICSLTLTFIMCIDVIFRAHCQEMTIDELYED